jgi:hypothetical protein
VGELQAMYDEYRDRADFYVVYIAEAHAEDGWQLESNVAEGALVKQHKTFEERRAAARLCAEALDLTIPMLLDGMDDGVNEAFSAWPERIYIIEGGKIVYRGGPGPYEFNPWEARAALKRMV